MRKQYTVANLVEMGFNLGDIDFLVWREMASYTSKVGITRLEVPNLEFYSNSREYFEDMGL
jgi:hypothetical protein